MYSRGGVRVNKNKYCRKIAFVLVMSLICTLIPFGNGHEKFYAADAVEGGNCFAVYACGSCGGQWVSPTCIYCGSACYFTGVYWKHFSNGVWVANDDYTCHTTCGQGCSSHMNTTAHSFGGEQLEGDSYYKYCTRCSRRVWSRYANYTITFNGNGATSGSMGQQSMTVGTAKSLYNVAFRKTGYTFAGWSTNKNATTASWGDGAYYNQSTAANVTLYAVWVKNPYLIVYSPNGGIGTMADTWTYYDTATTLRTNSFTRVGYTFKNWVQAGTGNIFNNGSSVINLSSSYNGVATLNAFWQANDYQVIYNGNGGTVDANGLEEYVSTVTYCDSPHFNIDLGVTATKTGMEFVGWNTDPNATTGLSFLEMPASNVTLYAIYSIPVSDVSEVYVSAWSNDDYSDIRTYLMNRSGEYNLDYVYEMSSMDISDIVNGVNLLKWAVTTWDYAGNYSSYGESTPVLQKYEQTVEHYRFDRILQDWICFAAVSEKCLEGLTYTPMYITPPEGYVPTSIDVPYIVQGDTISKAYYNPIEYTVHFDANGGEVGIDSKTIYYGDCYGELPTPERYGHKFIGWYTEPVGGDQVVSSDKYEVAGDSVVYAHWEVNKHLVYYDYETNEGTTVEREYETVDYGASVDLNVVSRKEGWEFVGWNTDPNATTGLFSLAMPDEDIILYAIYQKEVVATFVDNNGVETIVREARDTMYNKEQYVSMEVPLQNSMPGWTSLGWSIDSKADASIDASSNTFINLNESTIYYGVYESEITLTYDTNGSSEEIEPQTGKSYYNGSGDKILPEIKVMNAPMLDNSSFVIWQEIDADGNVLNEYEPGETYLFDENKTLTAKWDKYPTIEAYDRYFTLDEAISGAITADRLLEKVKGTDEEDGALENGKDVILLDYNPSTLLSEIEVDITIEATDSFGNKVTHIMKVTIVDTTVKESPTVYYTRFISPRFYSDGENLVAAEDGGLEETSVWRTNETYSRLISSSMSKQKLNEEYKIIDAFGLNQEVKVAGSGEWENAKETWVFTKEDIEEIKAFVKEHGYGNIKESGAIDLFYEQFGDCKQ